MRGAIVVLAASLLLLSGSSAPAAAQSGDVLLLRTFICETDPGGIGMSDLPEDCAEAGGILISVTDSSGAVVGECTSSDRGACNVQVPLGTTITVTEDVSTVPKGYAPTRNSIIIETVPQGYAGEFIREFINVPSGDVTLPDTGSGSASPGTQDQGVPAMAIASIVLSVVAYVLRRSGRLSFPS